MSSEGYIYVSNWEKFQHPDAIRSGHMPWMKLYTDMLGNDDWLDLRPADRVLHLGLLLLACRYGNGRIRADSKWLCAQLKIDWSGRYRGLERLSQAGFIEVRASKAASNRASKVASTDKEGSIEPKKESVASSARRNGAARKHRNRVAVGVATACSWLEDDAPHLVHRTVRETWPDLADEIIRQLPSGGAAAASPGPSEPAASDITDDDIPF